MPMATLLSCTAQPSESNSYQPCHFICHLPSCSTNHGIYTWRLDPLRRVVHHVEQQSFEAVPWVPWRPQEGVPQCFHFPEDRLVRHGAVGWNPHLACRLRCRRPKRGLSGRAKLAAKPGSAGLDNDQTSKRLIECGFGLDFALALTLALNLALAWVLVWKGWVGYDKSIAMANHG